MSLGLNELSNLLHSLVFCFFRIIIKTSAGPWDIAFIFDSSPHCVAVVTSITYESDSINLTDNLKQQKCANHSSTHHHDYTIPPSMPHPSRHASQPHKSHNPHDPMNSHSRSGYPTLSLDCLLTAPSRNDTGSSPWQHDWNYGHHRQRRLRRTGSCSHHTGVITKKNTLTHHVLNCLEETWMWIHVVAFCIIFTHWNNPVTGLTPDQKSNLHFTHIRRNWQNKSLFLRATLRNREKLDQHWFLKRRISCPRHRLNLP